MQADAASASTRNQALGLCRAYGFAAFQGIIRDDVPAADVAGLLIALERTFGVDLDADELWRGIIAAELAALVETKVADRARKALMPANDDIAGQPVPFLNRAQRRLVPPPPAAHAVRARRLYAAQLRRARNRRAFAGLIGVAVVVGLLAAGWVFLLERLGVAVAS